MIKDFEKLKNEICGLVFNTDPIDIEKRFEIDVSNLSLYRNFENVLVSFFLSSKKSSYISAGEYQYQIVIMDNYDIFARSVPYYDGDLDGLIPVYNQIKIFFLLKEKIPKLSYKS